MRDVVPCLSFLSRASADQQRRLLDAAYEVVQKGHVPLSSLLQAVERVVLPLAKHCSPAALGHFFVSNISDISATLLARFTKVGLTLEDLGSAWWRLLSFKLQVVSFRQTQQNLRSRY